MKNTILKFAALSLIMASFLTHPALAEKTTAVIKVFDKKTGEERSSGEFLVRFDDQTGELTQLTMGRGRVAEYENVRFLQRSILKDENPFKPLFSEATYYDEKDNNVGGFLIKYDHDKHLATFIRYKEKRQERFRREFAIEGPICDGLNMPLFLERFLLQHENLAASHFYLISSEPKLYKVNIYYRPTEEVQIGGQAVLAKKIQLIADMGPITNFVANFLPKTYLWFSARKPYRWLKYEGLEEGPDSAHIVVKLERQ